MKQDPRSDLTISHTSCLESDEFQHKIVIVSEKTKKKSDEKDEKTFLLRLPEKLHYDLKLKALKKGKTLTDLILESIEHFLKTK